MADILDNEWPIEWKSSEVVNNPQFVVDEVTFRKVSDITIDADWANVTAELTVKMETGDITLQSTQTIFDIDAMSVRYAALNEDMFYDLTLAYLPAGEYEGFTVPEAGLYYVIVDMDAPEESDPKYDINVKLSNPALDIPAQLSFDLQSWLTGFVIGLAGKPLPYLSPKKQLVVAGLFEAGTDTMIYSWEQLLGDELVEGGAIHVTDGVLTTNYSGASNESQDILAGDLVLPNDGSVITLGEYAFGYCGDLLSVNIPSNVTSIGDYAFSGCYDLESVFIDNKALSSIGGGTFLYTGANVYITDMASWCTMEVTGNENVFYNVNYLYLNKEPVIDLKIPDGVESVSRAFSSYARLNSIYIPDSLVNLNPNAFYNCRNITAVTVAGDNPAYCSVDNTIYSKDTTTLIARYVPYNGVFVVPDGVTTIGAMAFRHLNCTGKDNSLSMTGVELPDSLTTIETSAFSSCNGLTSITIPSGVTSIGGSAFALCKNLAEVIFEGTVEQWNAIELGNFVFLAAATTEIVCSDGTVTV